jgi:hypothetical protein
MASGVVMVMVMVMAMVISERYWQIRMCDSSTFGTTWHASRVWIRYRLQRKTPVCVRLR